MNQQKKAQREINNSNYLITEAGRAFIGDCSEACPYSGAKPYLLITGEKWEDHEWLTTLFKVSAEELPLPKRKI